MSTSSPSSLARPDGAAIAYHRSTGGDPGVIFMGGFRSDMTGAKALALETWCRDRNRAFIRFDYQGHGASSGRFENGSISRWLDDTLAVIDELSSGLQILIGSSMGGWLMLRAALMRPDRIIGLIGVASAADFTERLLWPRLSPAQREEIVRSGIIYTPSAYSDRAQALTLKLFEDGRNHLLLDDTIPLNCSVRLLHGMNDADIPWHTSVKIAERLSGADVRVILIKDGEHRLSRRTDLQLLTETLTELSSALYAQAGAAER